MIVEEPTGMAAHDTGRPFGCPYHGRVEGGEVTLPNGQSMVYPQPGGSKALFAGRTLLVRPPWAQGGTPTASEALAGKTWPDYAILGGSNAVLHGRALGEWCWLWAESPGVVWKVDASALDLTNPEGSPGATIPIELIRFGHFGPLGEGEVESRTINVTLPVLSTSPYRDQPYSLNPYARKVALADTHPANGAQAMFCVHMDFVDDKGCATVAVLHLDLAAESLTVMAEQVDQPWNEAIQSEMSPAQEPVVTNDEDRQAYSCTDTDGSTSTGEIVTLTPRVSGAQNHSCYMNRETIQRTRYIMGAAFTADGEPGPVYWEVDYHEIEAWDITASASGEKVYAEPDGDSGTCGVEEYDSREVIYDYRLDITRTATSRLRHDAGGTIHEASATATYWRTYNGGCGGSTQVLDGSDATVTGWYGDETTTTNTGVLGVLRESTNYGNVTNLFGLGLLRTRHIGVVAIDFNRFGIVAPDMDSATYISGWPVIETMTIHEIYNGAGLGGSVGGVAADYFRGCASVHPVSGEVAYRADGGAVCWV